MKRLKSLLALGSALVLFISACGQPKDLEKPNLKPQYGTSQDDSGSVVTATTSGQVYVLGSRGFYDENSLNTRWNTLTRFDSTGKQLWNQTLGQACNGTNDYCFSTAYSVNTDKVGNIYATYGYTRDYGFDATLKKFDPSGKLLWTKLAVGSDFGVAAAATSKLGETYVVVEFDNLGQSEKIRRLLKFNAAGQKVFEKTSAIVSPSDAVVAADGSLYVVGKDTLVKYSPAGNLVWKKTLPTTVQFPEIAVTSSHVYAASNTELNNRIALIKFTLAGSLVKQQTIYLPPSTRLEDLSIDANGNTYLAGSVNTEPEPGRLPARNRFVRKINTLGNSSWTYNPKSELDDFFNGVTASVSGQVYLVGSTDGFINGSNKGGYDAFLMRLNTAGFEIWQR